MNESYHLLIVKLDSSRSSAIRAGSSPLPCIEPISAYSEGDFGMGLGVVEEVIQESVVPSYRVVPTSYQVRLGTVPECRTVRSLPLQGNDGRTDDLDRIQIHKSVGGVTVGMA